MSNMMPNIAKVDIMKLQQNLKDAKEADAFDLVSKFHEWEQEAQSGKEKVMWNPKFRELIVNSFSGNDEVASKVEVLYLEMLKELYDAQEAIRDKIRKATQDIIEEAAQRLGI